MTDMYTGGICMLILLSNVLTTVAWFWSHLPGSFTKTICKGVEHLEVTGSAIVMQ